MEGKPVCTICMNSEVVLQESRLRLYYCEKCDHCFTDAEENPALYNDEYYKIQRKNWFDNPDFWLYEKIYQRIISLVPPPMKILDLGCGNGAFLKYLKKKDKPMELSGIDFIDNDYKGINFIKADFNSFKTKEKFDVVTSFMSIEHIKDVNGFVSRINNIINQRKGWMIINTINNNSLIYLIARFLNKLGFRVAHDRLYEKVHLNHFTNKSLKKLVEKNGWDVVEHWNHNYSMTKVDVPRSNLFVRKLYKFGIWIMFRISDFSGNGHSQTLICKKEWKKS